MTFQRRQRNGLNFRGIEQLESRDMLAAHPFFGAFAQAAQFAPQFNAFAAPASFAAQIAAHNQLFGNFAAHANNSHQTTLTATLSDPDNSAASGTVTYQTGKVDGTVQTTFSVSVTGAAADSTLDVSVGGTSVGTITTDDTGAGSLVLSSNPTGTQQSLPDDFPTTVDAGTAVSVGTLAGNLATQTRSEGGCSAARTSLSATLSDPDNASAAGTINYKTSTVDGTTQTVFSVSVTGAAADSTLDVTVGSTVVGQLTTDDTGAGSVEWSSDPTGTQQALPTNFPTSIDPGTTVSVGTLSGTLSSTGHSSFHSFFRRH